jgi:hypothetical protein
LCQLLHALGATALYVCIVIYLCAIWIFPNRHNNYLNEVENYCYLPTCLRNIATREGELGNARNGVNFNFIGPRLSIDEHEATSIRPKYTNSWPMIQRLRRTFRTFNRRYRLIETKQRHRSRVKRYRTNHWTRLRKRRKRQAIKAFIKALPRVLRRALSKKGHQLMIRMRFGPDYTEHVCNKAFITLHKGFVSRLLGLGATEAAKDGRTAQFDTDSYRIAVDPCASATILNNASLFKNLKPIRNTYLAGVGGRIPMPSKGTAVFYIEDDLGKRQKVVIKDAYYAPDSPLSLLCPQQWATQRTMLYGRSEGAQFVVTAKESRLVWDYGTRTKTIAFNHSNIPMLHTAPGYKNSNAFVCRAVSTQNYNAMPAAAEISDSDDSDDDINDN